MSALATQSSTRYDQIEKKKCRSSVIEHAVRCLTIERETSVCVQRDHVDRVWKKLRETGKAQQPFKPHELQEIEKAIEDWKSLYDSNIKPRKPSDLRVCYLCGDNPINDLEILVQNGVLCQNVVAIEKDSKTLEKAKKAISQSKFRNCVHLYDGDFLNYCIEVDEKPFDIIYIDACGSLPAAKQKTLKVIGYVFLHSMLSSPGALITNFSFPTKKASEETKIIQFMAEEYLKWREVNAEFLKTRTVEENYSDYITTQIIDSASLFIPARRMLLSNSLWDQIFVSRDKFLKEMKLYVANSSHDKWDKLLTEEDTLQVDCRNIARDSCLRKLGFVFQFEKANPLCTAWVNQIFPDWKDSFLKKEDISLLLLTPHLFSSEAFVSRFWKDATRLALDEERGKFPSFCDVGNSSSTACLAAGLRYGYWAHPSFPVVEKLLRLSYTAKDRQMFSDVFIFDKCRYVYNQLSAVDFAHFEPKQMVFRMAVDGLNIGSIANPNSGLCFPSRLNLNDFKYINLPVHTTVGNAEVSMKSDKSILAMAVPQALSPDLEMPFWIIPDSTVEVSAL